MFIKGLILREMLLKARVSWKPNLIQSALELELLTPGHCRLILQLSNYLTVEEEERVEEATVSLSPVLPLLDLLLSQLPVYPKN